MNEMKPEMLKIEVVRGCEGNSLYINDRRVAGNKPWGGGTVISNFNVPVKKLQEALEEWNRRA